MKNQQLILSTYSHSAQQLFGQAELSGKVDLMKKDLPLPGS